MHFIVRTMLAAATLAPSASVASLAHDAGVLTRVLPASQSATPVTVRDTGLDATADTATDTTTTVWRYCSAVWDQVQRRLYKRWATQGDIPGYNQHTYACVRNASVYLVKAKDFTRMFAPYSPTSRSDTAKPTPYDMPSLMGREHVYGGMFSGGLDTIDIHCINLIDSPYKGAKEFEQLLEGFREHLPLRQSGPLPLIVLNGVPVKDLNTPIDINHLNDITVFTGPEETYPDEIKQFYNPGGLILINYWVGP